MADVDPESDAATVGSTRTRRRAEVGLFTKVETKSLTCESATKHRVEKNYLLVSIFQVGRILYLLK